MNKCTRNYMYNFISVFCLYYHVQQKNTNNNVKNNVVITGGRVHTDATIL